MTAALANPIRQCKIQLLLYTRAHCYSLSGVRVVDRPCEDLKCHTRLLRLRARGSAHGRTIMRSSLLPRWAERDSGILRRYMV